VLLNYEELELLKQGIGCKSSKRKVIKISLKAEARALKSAAIEKGISV